MHDHAHDCDHHHVHHEDDTESSTARRGCNHGPLDHHDSSHDALCIDKLSFSYGDTQALEDITLHVHAGCNLGIIGPNGGGKTTLLRIILGQLTGYEGKVSIMGLSPKQVCKLGDIVGYVPQHYDFDPAFPISVRQVIKLGLCGKTGLFRRHSAEDLARVDQLMEQVGIADLRDRPIGELSGGQRQRAFVAKALAAGPKILLLDEPTVGIDVSGRSQFTNLITQLHRDLGLTVMIVTHDLRTVAGCCEKVACLSRTLHFHDSPEGLTPSLLREVFDHDIEPLLAQPHV